MPCKYFKHLSEEASKAFLSSFDNVLADCDGVLWKGNNAIPGSPETINALRKAGKKILYLTNNATKSRKQYVEKCHVLGFKGEFQDVFTTSYLCARYLKRRNFSKKVYVFGSEGIANELDEVGIPHIGVGKDPMPEAWSTEEAMRVTESLDKDVGCVIASYTLDLSYMKLLKATCFLKDPDVLFIATNSDPQFPFGPTCTIPGTGAFVAAVKTASGRDPVIMGKPEVYMFDAVKAAHPDIVPERTLMIGDRADTDILLGRNCSLKTLMVGTGTNNLEEVRQWEASGDAYKERLVPDFYADCLGDLLPYIE